MGRPYARSAVLWMGVVVVALATLPWGRWERFGTWSTGLATAILAAVTIPLFSTIFHELCHAFVAWLTGHRILALYAWFPTPVMHLRLGTGWLVLGRIIRGGMCQLIPRHRDDRPSVWVYAAGPLGNLLLAGIFGGVWLSGLEGFWGRLWCPMAAAYNVYIFGSNLWPRQANVVGAAMKTDGYVLYHRWSTWGEDSFEEASIAYGISMLSRGSAGSAELHLRHALARNPESVSAKEALAMVLYSVGRIDEAARIWTTLGALDLPNVRAVSMNNLALYYTLSPAGRNLEEADRLSRQALELQPWNVHFQGTRGLVLVDQGFREEGMRLLLGAYRNHVLPASRGAAAALLARASRDQGNLREAHTWLRRARRLGAARWLVDEAEGKHTEDY